MLRLRLRALALRPRTLIWLLILRLRTQMLRLQTLMLRLQTLMLRLQMLMSRRR